MTAQTDDGIEHTPARSRLASVFGLVGSSLGAIFLAGASVGFFSAHDPSRPLSTVGLLVGAGLVGGTVLCLWLAALIRDDVVLGEDQSLAAAGV